MEQANGGGGLANNASEMLEPEPSTEKPKPVRARTGSITQRDKSTHNGPHTQPCTSWDGGSQVQRRLQKTDGGNKGETGEPSKQPPCRRPLSLEIKPQRIRAAQPVRKVIQPPWRSGGPSPPTRSLTSLSLGQGNWLRRSESTCTVSSTMPLRSGRGQMRPATSLPHIARGIGPLPSPSTPRGPCLLVALRPTNLEQERQTFFQSDYQYEPQFEYAPPEPISVLEKYREGSGLFLSQVYILSLNNTNWYLLQKLVSCLTVNCLRKQLPSNAPFISIGIHVCLGVLREDENVPRFHSSWSHEFHTSLDSLHNLSGLWTVELFKFTIHSKKKKMVD